VYFNTNRTRNNLYVSVYREYDTSGNVLFEIPWEQHLKQQCKEEEKRFQRIFNNYTKNKQFYQSK
jgi:hypothetical protein